MDSKMSQLRCYKDFAAMLLNANDDQILTEISGASRGIFVDLSNPDYSKSSFSCDIFVEKMPLIFLESSFAAISLHH